MIIKYLLMLLAYVAICQQTFAADNKAQYNTNVIGKFKTHDNKNNFLNINYSKTMKFLGIEVSPGILIGQADQYDNSHTGIISNQEEDFWEIDNLGVAIEKRF